LHWAGASGKTTEHVNEEAAAVTTKKFGLDDGERFCTGEEIYISSLGRRNLVVLKYTQKDANIDI
jgi:hypothetical protein